MFEKAMPSTGRFQHDSLSGDMLVGSRERVPAGGGDALRAIEWGELTARLNAARDLRRVLRREERLSIETSGASFGDAAATYFQSLGNDERPVNPVVLEASKASHGIGRKPEGEFADGDARDE